jgi:hypothetical protein
MQKSHKDKKFLALWLAFNFIYKIVLLLAIFMIFITISFYVSLLNVNDLNFNGVLKVDVFILFIIVLRNFIFYKYIKK